MKSIPYASASTGAKARGEITAVLCRFGCESDAGGAAMSPGLAADRAGLLVESELIMPAAASAPIPGGAL
jgi:hypothetical protein